MLWFEVYMQKIWSNFKEVEGSKIRHAMNKFVELDCVKRDGLPLSGPQTHMWTRDMFSEQGYETSAIA